MRTTLTLENDLVEEVLKATSAKNKTRAVTTALREFVRRKKIDRLRSLLGTVELDLESISKLRQLEMRETAGSYGKRSR